MNIREFLDHLAETHAAIFGLSGSGKSMFLVACADALAKNPIDAFTFICPHGTARMLAERLAHPMSGCPGRTVHVFDPASDHVMGINPFETYDKSWAAAHEASLLWTSSVASLYATAMAETPRLEKNFYVLGMFAAAKNLTLIELLQALSLGAGARVREFLLSDFENAAARQELEDLHFLAHKQPARFLELTESCRNRLVRWLSNNLLARPFALQKGLDARAVMDDRDIVLVDLSAFPAEDANFIATLLVCRYFAAAKRRPPNACARHFLIVDEAAGSLCTATAQLLDQARKFGLRGIFSLQRIGQLREKGDFITDAVMVNAGVKAVFSLPEPESARYLAEMLNSAYVDLEEWKPGSSRPTVVGNEKVILRGRSRGHAHATHRAAGIADISSYASGVASVSGTSSAHGSGSGSGQNNSYLQTPAGLMTMPADLSHSQGFNSSQNSSALTARTNARAASAQFAHGRARSSMRGESVAYSDAVTEAEAIIPVWEDLPTQLFSLEEQLHKCASRIMNLKPREVILKYIGAPPILTRTPDLTPAFTGPALKAEIVPRFLANVARLSPYLVPKEEVDAELASRFAGFSLSPQTPEPDFTTPEPMPDITVVDDPEIYARQFLKRIPTPDDVPPAPPAPPPGRKPLGELGPEHDRFRVIDGDADKNQGDNQS